jgi:hypothetical protein
MTVCLLLEFLLTYSAIKANRQAVAARIGGEPLGTHNVLLYRGADFGKLLDVTGRIVVVFFVNEQRKLTHWRAFEIDPGVSYCDCQRAGEAAFWQCGASRSLLVLWRDCGVIATGQLAYSSHFAFTVGSSLRFCCLEVGFSTGNKHPVC